MYAIKDLDTLRQTAIDRCEEISIELLGLPSQVRPNQLRWGKRGALALQRSGDRRGAWYDFSTGKGGDIFALVAEMQQCDIASAFRWVREQLSLVQFAPQRQTPKATPSGDAVSEASRIAAARSLWFDAVPGYGTAAERYFKRRELAVPEDVWPLIRFSSSCWFSGERGTHPAIILPFTNISSGEVTAVHKIAIHPDGQPVCRSDGSKLKLSAGLVKGAAIAVRPLPDLPFDLCLCEGFETALGIAMSGWRRPLYAMSGASFLAKLQPIEGIGRLVIGADNDPSGTGLTAAVECGRRWAMAGVFVEITWPNEPGKDFADHSESFVL